MKAQAIQDSRWVGRILRDKWRIDGRIARGGMGTVFAATHRNNGSRAAIKILHPEFSRDKDTRSRFLQEGYAANQVNHPGVVRIIDDDVTEEGLAYLVMELLEGELLEQRRLRKGGKLPLQEVLEFSDQLLDVLTAAHGKDIVHRDIKPDNIFLTTEGRIKVLDFGFAQMKSGFRTEQTATGFLLGTPGFMAPEQAVGNRPQIDAQTDIWAVGATMFILLTGQPVHAGESPAEMLVAAANYAARPVASLEPGLPPHLAEVVDRALAFDKADRFADARAMQSALREVPGKSLASAPIRRSIVDDEERYARFNAALPADDSTLLDDVEDVDEAELHDRSQDRTVARVYEPHPADQEKPTMAAFGRTGPSSITKPRMASDPALSARVPSQSGGRPPSDRAVLAQKLGSFSGRAVETPRPVNEGGPPRLYDSLSNGPGEGVGDSTLVMESRPMHPTSGPMHAVRPAAGHPARSSYPDYYAPTVAPQRVQQPPTIPVSFDRVPVPTREKPPSKMLLYVVVAGVTMVVVILTGLVVILGLD